MADGFIKSMLLGRKTDNPEPEKDEPVIPTGRIQGKVIRTHRDGWGFISSHEVPFYRIFFYWQDLDPSIHFPKLHVKTKLEFEVRYDPTREVGKRYSAKKITLVKE